MVVVVHRWSLKLQLIFKFYCIYLIYHFLDLGKKILLNKIVVSKKHEPR